MPKFDIVTFGSAVIDIFVSTDVKQKGKYICYPAGSKIILNDLKWSTGGGSTNTAVGFSRLGFKTGCICQVANDDDGDIILNELKKEKIRFLGNVVKSNHNLKDQEAITGYSIVLDSKEHIRTILTYRGVNDTLSLDDIWKFKTKWLYMSSLLGKSFQSQLNLAKYIKQNYPETKIVYNPNEYLIKTENLKSLLRFCDVLILNKEEAELLTKKKTEIQMLKSIASLGPKISVITNNEKKVYCYSAFEDKIYTLMPNKINVIEKTGAGDAFAVGFVSGLMLNWQVKRCLSLGQQEAEAIMKHFGAKNNLIKRKLK